VVVFYEPPGCVKVLNPRYDSRLPQKPHLIADAMQLSRIDLVKDHAQAARPPQPYYGPEPAHGWCYYFEKAELARQQDDWQAVASLGDEILAQQADIRDYQATELLPYIEAYARLGEWERARELTFLAYQLDAKTQKALCDTWMRVKTETRSTEGEPTFEKIEKKLQCPIASQS
jgi:hypothetical protein